MLWCSFAGDGPEAYALVEMAKRAALTNPIPLGPMRRLSVDQYRRMGQAGILTADDNVELLEGFLVDKMTKNPPHRIATRKVRVALEAVIPPGWYVDTQEPIVTEDSEPEPDGAVIRGKTEDYLDENPSAAHVSLVVEVADVTLLRDRRTKSRVYARAAIASYWIVNLIDRCLEAYSDPLAGDPEPHYTSQHIYREGDSVPVTVAGSQVGSVRVADLLPGERKG
jgi:Uma2 family endonuclease